VQVWTGTLLVLLTLQLVVVQLFDDEALAAVHVSTGTLLVLLEPQLVVV